MTPQENNFIRIIERSNAIRIELEAEALLNHGDVQTIIGQLCLKCATLEAKLNTLTLPQPPR